MVSKNEESSFTIEEGNKKTNWVSDMYNLPIVISYNFTISHPEHELIGVFSFKRGEWGSGSDGLTWHVASHRCDH